MNVESVPEKYDVNKTRVSTRILGIDAIRYFGVFSIVLIHMFSKNVVTFDIDIGSVVTEISRFAVPFFFISGGFFLGFKDVSRTISVVISILKRIVPVFAFWVVIYLLISQDTISSILKPKYLLILLATGGPGFHLWFLPSFALCMTLVAVLFRYFRWSYMFAIALTLYVAGLLIGSYGGLFLPLGHATAMALSIARGGPFFGTIFVLFGLWLAKTGWRASVWLSLVVLLIGLALHLAEAYVLDINHLTEFSANDFLFGTLALGAGAFCASLHLPSNDSAVKAFGRLGKYTLGIYVVHLFFVFTLRSLLHPVNFGEKLGTAIIVLLASTLLTLALAQIKSIRFLVT